MKGKELLALSKDELMSRLSELKRELIKYNAQVGTGTVPKSPGLIKKAKKNIARILTALNRREA